MEENLVNYISNTIKDKTPKLETRNIYNEKELITSKKFL